MIIIEMLQEKDVEQASSMIQEVILNTPYYAEVSKRAQIDFYVPELMKGRLKGDGDLKFIYLVAKIENEIIGAVIGSGYPADGVFNFDWITVHSAHREKGVGKSLMQELERTVKNSGFHKIVCDSRTNNKESVPMLEKIGYRKVGELKDHWFHQDYYIWEKIL